MVIGIIKQYNEFNINICNSYVCINYCVYCGFNGINLYLN